MLILLSWLYSEICVLGTPVVPKKVSAITRCPRFGFSGQKNKIGITMEDFFYNTSKKFKLHIF